MPTCVEVLGPEGLIAQRMPAYESRPQQVEMAEVVAQALAAGQHAIVEAPTGVGKSFAYLVPLVLHALATGQKVVVSTGTIALQEQLIRKDIPFLQRLFPELKAALVKGRQNYMSRRRLRFAAARQQGIFETREDAHTFKELFDWSSTTTVGDRTDLGWDPPAQVWRLVQSDRNNCLGRKCQHYGECFFYKARREMEEAHLLVVNHHLYFSDLGLRDDHASILPPHQVVVFDEAHSLEDVATDHLGASVSEGMVRYYLDGLWNRRNAGLLGPDYFSFAREAVETARMANETFWKSVALLVGDGANDTVRLAKPGAVDNVLSPALDLVAAALAVCRERADGDDLKQECTAQLDRCIDFSGSVRGILDQVEADRIHFAYVPRGRGSAEITSAPLQVAPLLKEKLFSRLKTVVLTSATLAADDSDRFLFLRRRLGLETGLARRLSSPFDFQRQAKLILNTSPIDPNSPRFERAVAAWLADHLARAQGGTFVLFTSYRQLTAVHDLVRPILDRANRFVLRHGDRIGRAQMLDLFKRTGDAILFGTSSFWEGVDVPGDALKNVIITKLPFEVPTHPVIEARHQEIKRRGGNSFMERTVPEAIIRLKQGFGRLIRTRTDTGSVVILDHRILTTAYGHYFLRALPPCASETVELQKYLTDLSPSSDPVSPNAPGSG